MADQVLSLSDTNSKILTQQNFIPDYACNWLIDFHKRYFNSLGHIDDHNRHVLDLNYATHSLRFDNEFNDSDPLKYLQSKILRYISNVDQFAFINYAQIVFWPENSHQPKHLDFNYHSWTSILYLNDVVVGGAIEIENTIIQPKQGCLVTFKGNKLHHAVHTVKDPRYTVSVWYKNFEE